MGATFAPAAYAIPAAVPRRLSFENLHTGERLQAAYWQDGGYDPAACRKIDWILRDHRAGLTTPIATNLLDLLHAIRGKLSTDEPFQVISGYRSPGTNAHLARMSSGVASNSLHMQGLAIDVRLPGCALSRLRDTAKALKVGGVGYYAKSDFVHIDVGRVRYW
jgi:uncharacterized protein YcbK (DUF882 family)